jgi:hypothetical protein
MVIFTQGPAGSAHLAAFTFVDQFPSFDAFVVSAGANVRKWYFDHESWMRAGGHPDLVFYFFGYSEKRERPEGYMIRCAYDKAAFDRDGKVSRDGWFWNRKVKLKPFQVLPISGNLSISPGVFSKDELAAAAFPVHLQAKDLVPEVDMLHIMEMMRRKPCSRFPEEPARVAVGGHALLTTIGATGVTQKLLAEYPDDIGKPIKAPAPLDWKQWRDDQLRVPANDNRVF